MTVGLEKLVQDIKNETCIWPIEKSKNTAEEEAAWNRIGARNKMSGSHVKSIFKVLSKKYEAEKTKPNTNWKLFEYLKFLDEKNEPEKEDEEDDVPDDADLEDDGEFVELLEVNEYEESEDEENGSAASESSKNNSIEDEQQKVNAETETAQQKGQIAQAIKKNQQPNQKLPITSTPTTQPQIKQIKGIEVKKIVPQQKMLLNNLNEQNKKLNNSNETLIVEAKLKQNYEAARQTQYNKQQQTQRTVPESLKRKLPAEQKQSTSSDNSHKENSVSPPIKKQAIIPQGVTIERIVSTQKTTSESNSGQNSQLTSDRKIKLLNTVDKSSTHLSLTNENDTEMKKIHSPEQQKLKSYVKLSPKQQNGFLNEKSIKKEIVDISDCPAGANDNIPAFFRDLYNSKKYDCFGMYVASAMNRLPTQLATLLERKILQCIIEVNATITNDGDQ